MPSTITGGKAVARRLGAIAPGLATPLTEASRKAMRPMLAAAKALAPVDDGDLKRSLTIKSKRGQTVVGPNKKFIGRDGAKPGRVAHLVEFGRAAGANGRGGMPGTRFMSRAFEATKDQVVKIFGSEIGPAIERRAQKLRGPK